ncbi:MAG: glycosyltransferase family 4 protein [Alphaproteobacteria bacterium]|nr:glycosyltransferase family 4 protein [Alphaproteobacteria bacterium]
MKVCQLANVDFALHHFLMPLMRAIRERGHEVVGVCADGPLVAKARAEGFRIETAPLERSYDLIAHARAFRHLRRFFAAERFDLVHVHTPLAGLIGRFAARAARVPRIAYTAHGFYFHEHMPAAKRAFFVGLERLGRSVTDVLMTQSEEDAAAARALRIAPRGAVSAIGNGVDPALFHPPAAEAEQAERAALRAELGAAPDDVVVLMTGRMVAEKGYPELFAAMARAMARSPCLRLWCVGSRLASDHAASIDAAIAAAEADPLLGPRLRLLGYRGDMPRLLRAADLFTLPSHREGMPRSIIEAMMTGLAVVATDIRGAREEVLAGETGLLVPLGDVAALADAFAGLGADAARRATMGAAGRARALDLYDEAKVIARQIDLLGL